MYVGESERNIRDIFEKVYPSAQAMFVIAMKYAHILGFSVFTVHFRLDQHAHE